MIDLNLDRVSKRYRIRQEISGSQSRNGWIGKARRWFANGQEFWAVRDVSFQVPRGQALGIIGHNGAGKSTLLKLLSGITAPSRGEITIQGRLSALLEVGSGFHPELTGRENVFLSGSILGMKRREIQTKLDSIVEFAGVRQFIDVPVKRYSSGMLVRLGFSVAAHLEPNVLLLDEVLAVGDAAFQKKCIGRVRELKQRGVTIVFVSHDLKAVESLCDRVLLMNEGRVAYEGEPGASISQYSNLVRFRPSSKFEPADGVKQIEITSLQFLDASGAPAPSFKTGHPLRVRIEYVAHASLPHINFGIFFYAMDGNLACQFTTSLGSKPPDLEPGLSAIEFTCDELSLQPGSYMIDVTVEQFECREGLDWQYRCSTLQVDPGKTVRGSFYHPHSWRVISTAPDARP